jgi:hypothetical protein
LNVNDFFKGERRPLRFKVDLRDTERKLFCVINLSQVELQKQIVCAYHSGKRRAQHADQE